MYIHHFLRSIYEQGNDGGDRQGNGLIGQIQELVFAYSPKSFFYNISGVNYSLEEIKHGLLRNNRKPPLSYTQPLNRTDPRAHMLKGYSDPRILFVCLDHPDCLELIDTFEGASDERLDAELESFTKTALESRIEVNLEKGEIIIPKAL